MKLIVFIFSSLSFLGCSTVEVQRDPVFEETKVRNSRPKLQYEVFDVKESDKKYEQAFIEADLLAERRVGNVARNKQFILEFWHHKKEILAEEYGISWSSPAELNPDMCYESYGQPCITEAENTAITKFVEENRKSEDEVVGASYRDYKGFVYVGTIAKNSGVSREYTLLGIGKEWALKSVFVIEE